MEMIDSLIWFKAYRQLVGHVMLKDFKNLDLIIDDRYY